MSNQCQINGRSTYVNGSSVVSQCQINVKLILNQYEKMPSKCQYKIKSISKKCQVNDKFFNESIMIKY